MITNVKPQLEQLRTAEPTAQAWIAHTGKAMPVSVNDRGFMRMGRRMRL